MEHLNSCSPNLSSLFHPSRSEASPLVSYAYRLCSVLIPPASVWSASCHLVVHEQTTKGRGQASSEQQSLDVDGALGGCFDRDDGNDRLRSVAASECEHQRAVVQCTSNGKLDRHGFQQRIAEPGNALQQRNGIQWQLDDEPHAGRRRAFHEHLKLELWKCSD